MHIHTMHHDDVIKWKHFPYYWPFVIHRPLVNSPHKGQWRRALMFSLICSWINGWVNNREAGDLRCHHAHYDVTVMHLEIKVDILDIGSTLNHLPCAKMKTNIFLISGHLRPYPSTNDTLMLSLYEGTLWLIFGEFLLFFILVFIVIL